MKAKTSDSMVSWIEMDQCTIKCPNAEEFINFSIWKGEWKLCILRFENFFTQCQKSCMRSQREFGISTLWSQREFGISTLQSQREFGISTLWSQIYIALKDFKEFNLMWNLF